MPSFHLQSDKLRDAVIELLELAGFVVKPLKFEKNWSVTGVPGETITGVVNVTTVLAPVLLSQMLVVLVGA